MSVLLVGLVAGIAGFMSHFAAIITGSLNNPASEAVGNAMLSLWAVYTVSGVLFVGRAAASILRHASAKPAWFYLATSTVCIATCKQLGSSASGESAVSVT